MTIPVPQLDDRRFDDLVEEARTFLHGKTEAWTDFSPGDPGDRARQLFAHLTDLMISAHRARRRTWSTCGRLVDDHAGGA